MSEIEVTFPGGYRVDARVGSHIVRTDQPESAGGEGSAPGPFDLFLASLATCAGVYALGYCRARGFAVEGMKLVQQMRVDPTTMLPTHFELQLTLPPSVPEHHRAAILRAMTGCKVKKTMAALPEITIVLAAAAAQPEDAAHV